MGQGLLGAACGVLGASWGSLGRPLGALGCSLGAFGRCFGGLGGSTGGSGTLLGGSWVLVGTKRNQRRGQNEQEKTKRKNELRLGHPKMGKRGGKEVKLMEKWCWDRRKTHARRRSHAGIAKHQTKRVNECHQSLLVEEVVF